MEALNESILDSSERAAVKMRFSPCFKINDLCHRFWRHVPMPRANSDSIRVSLRLGIILLFLSGLPACGQKGDLYLPARTAGAAAGPHAAG